MEQPESELRNELEERLQFEALLVDISSQFINLAAEQIDSRIEDIQHHICQCLGMDLSSLWQWSSDSPQLLTLTHLYSLPEGPSRPERINAQESFPWQFHKLLAGETLAFSTEDMPPEAAIDQESRRFFGIKSSVVMPLSIGGGPLIGVLTFDTLHEERDWSFEAVKRLQLVAQIVCNALIRKESEKILRENEARLNLAADSAGAGLWELNVTTGLFWTTEKAQEIFGYPSGEVVDMERVEQSIHPEDLEHVRRAIARSFNEYEPFNVEYRIRANNEATKWINSTGQPFFKANGEPDRLLGVSIDITERKTLEYERIMSQERLASAIDIAGLGFYEMGEDLRLKFLDNRMCSFLGISPDDEAEPRQFWLEHIHRDDISFVQGVIRKVLEEGVDRFELEYRYLHPERGLTWLHHLSRVQERNDKGNAIRVIGVMQDITEQKRVDTILRMNRKTIRNNQQDLQRLAGKLILTQEEELRRLSRELHDDLTQRLAVLAITAGKLELQLKGMDQILLDGTGHLISSIKDELIAVSEDVHRISRQLHPTILEDLGLVRAIESEIAAITKRDALDIIFSREAVPENIPKEISLCLYRVIQEGIRNIIRHAGVDRCTLWLQVIDNALSLTIQDDGVGFDRGEVRNKPGLGLSSMRERVQLVRGDFAIDTQPGQGTIIKVCVPLRKENT